MPINEDLVKYTQLLGMINGLIPVAITLGTTVGGLVKEAIAAGRGDAATVEEAQLALANFRAATADTKSFIDTWLAEHPPTA